MKRKPTYMSVLAYAKRRAERGLPGGSVVAVQAAIKSGRLRDSLTHDDAGRPKIADPDIADREWERNTAASYRPRTGPTATKAARSSSFPASDLHDQDDGEEPDYNRSRARREAALARMAELELGEREGQLLRAADVSAKLVSVFGAVRVRVLGTPAKIRQLIPGLDDADMRTINAILREALEDLADGGTLR